MITGALPSARINLHTSHLSGKCVSKIARIWGGGGGRSDDHYPELRFPTQLGRRYECTISGEISAISNLDHLQCVFSRFFYMVGKILVSSTKSIL